MFTPCFFAMSLVLITLCFLLCFFFNGVYFWGACFAFALMLWVDLLNFRSGFFGGVEVVFFCVFVAAQPLLYLFFDVFFLLIPPEA